MRLSHPLVLAVPVVASLFACEALHAQRVSVDLRNFQSSQLRMLDVNGVRQLATASPILQLRPGQYVIDQTGTAASVDTAGNRVRYSLPIRLVGADATGRRVSLRPVVEIEMGGLRVQPAQNFSGSIRIGVEDETQGPPQPLGMAFQMLVTANADSVSPASVSVDHTNLPFDSVRIVALGPGDSVRVRVRPTFDQAVELDIPVVWPIVTLDASPRRIQGFGLETAVLTLQANGLPPSMSVAVALNADRSRTEPSSVQLGAANVSTVVIRSNGIGIDSVAASGALLRSTPIAVEYVFPWAFLFASLLGGVVGGLIRYIVLKSKKTENIALIPLLVHVLLGVLTGLLTTVAYAVGINLLGVQPSATIGEALVFVISAFGAIASSRIVSLIVASPGGAPAAG